MKLNQRYHLLKNLAEGSMSEVYLAEDLRQDKKLVAVKIISNRRINIQSVCRFKTEFLIMTRLRHPNLVKVLDFGFERRNSLYYLVMEYIDGSTLSQYIDDTPFSVEKYANYLVQLLRALEFVHSRNILYRDLKPDNIMIDAKSNQLKLLDFGLSDLMKFKHDQVKGTVKYIAPEIIKKEHPTRGSDIFSYGILLWEVYTGKEFYTDLEVINILPLMHDVKKYNAKLNSMLLLIKDDKLKQIIAKCLAYNPNKRFNFCSEIIMSLNQCWSKNYSIETPATNNAYLANSGFIDFDGSLHSIMKIIKKKSDSIICINGDFGCGKSRLLRELKYLCLLRNFFVKELPVYDKTDLAKTELFSSLDNSVIREKRAAVLLIDDISDQTLPVLIKNKKNTRENLKIVVTSSEDKKNCQLLSNVFCNYKIHFFTIASITKSQLNRYLQDHLGKDSLNKKTMHELIEICDNKTNTPAKINQQLAILFSSGRLKKIAGKWKLLPQEA